MHYASVLDDHLSRHQQAIETDFKPICIGAVNMTMKKSHPTNPVEVAALSVKRRGVVLFIVMEGHCTM